MNEDRNPKLESLFAQEQGEIADECFTSAVMAGVRLRRQRIVAVRITFVILLVALELIMDSPLQHSLGIVAESLGTTLYEIENDWMAFVLSPVNSLAGLLGLLLLGMHAVYRRLVH